MENNEENIGKYLVHHCKDIENIQHLQLSKDTLKLNSGIDRLWFNCVIDKKTGKVLSAGVGKLNARQELHSRGAAIARND
ncbi:hypothetical protein BH18THE2_BH18THE2_20520 [soil metagenome]